jgi:tetratricopeptide (TPR) repeat protein
VVPPAAESVGRDADERLLAEYALTARQAYLDSLDRLEQFYRKHEPGGYKAVRVANVRARFDAVRTYEYFLNAQIPGPDLRPTVVNPEADALYDQAMKLYSQGKGILHTFVTTDYDKERQALGMLRELIEKYPHSTKIAMAAYYIGEIYKEYFNEDVLAVHWYERAWQWDPNIPKPARFQAATVYDLRLMQKPEAIECYRGALEYEQFNKSNCDFARKRLRDLEQQ